MAREAASGSAVAEGWAEAAAGWAEEDWVGAGSEVEPDWVVEALAAVGLVEGGWAAAGWAAGVMAAEEGGSGWAVVG